MRGRTAQVVGLIAVASACVAAAAEPRSLTNSLGMTMVRIEPGTFTMGSAEGGAFDERPAHRVTLSKSFYLATTEVTNAQYEEFDRGHKQLRGKLGFSKADDEAVVFVSWIQATAFCRWLGQKEGKSYRLPTEAEWEYACRAGTTGAYWTGAELPKAFRKNVRNSWYPAPIRSSASELVSLAVAKTPPNPWGLYDMHGNVEEWCADWYGPYPAGPRTDPVGRANGQVRVTRGGSHSTLLTFLRSANRSGMLPDDKTWLVGFRVALGPTPTSRPLPAVPACRCQQDVTQEIPGDPRTGPDPSLPYFKGPRRYVKIPAGSEGPLFSKHNHDPAIVECPNGDLLAIWYTCRTEPGRELGIAASRLRRGAEQWEPASPFWDVPDRNDHAPALWADGKGTLYHFNGLSAAGTWGSLATILRTSTDSGATWSTARLINPEHGLRHMPVESVFQTREGWIVLPCDAVPGGSGGTAIHISKDGGRTWHDPASDTSVPDFKAGGHGGSIAGIHAGVVQLRDGRLMAFGRGNNIDGHMPMSISRDMGRSWTYSASPFPPIGGNQRLVLMRLREGPLLLVSFTHDFFKYRLLPALAPAMYVTDAAGQRRRIFGMFAALSFDDGKTWSCRKPVTPGGPPQKLTGVTLTGDVTFDATHAEPRGYLSGCQTPDGVIHIISSGLHYAFNVMWVKTPIAAAHPEIGVVLPGWRVYSETPSTKDDGVWRSDDGTLTCKGTPKGYLYTDKDYTNFTLRLEWRWPPGKNAGNGGVLLRMTGPHKIWPRSLEAQINTGDAGDFWGLDGYALSGPPERLKTLDHPQFGRLTNLKKLADVEKPPGQWNQYEIVADGETVTLKINGRVVNRATGCKPILGKICLTAEGDAIEFRNIRLSPK